MTILLVDGLEDQSSWTVVGTPATAAARHGNGCTPGAGANTLTFNLLTADQTDTVTVGVAIKCGALGAISTFFTFRSDAAATLHDSVQITTTGAVQVVRSGTTLATSAAGVIVIGTWTYIEATVKLSDTVGTVSVRANGTVVASATGVDTKNAGTKTVFDAVQFVGSGTNLSYQFDDLYITNDTTTYGDCGVETLYPTGDGAANQWLGSDIDSVSNWALVDEVPVATTDYVTDGTTGHQDLYALSDLVGFGAGGSVVAVCHQAYATRSDATAKSIKLVSHRTTDTKSASAALGTAYGPFHYILATDPETSAAWLSANVNALQSGVEVA